MQFTTLSITLLLSLFSFSASFGQKYKYPQVTSPTSAKLWGVSLTTGRPLWSETVNKLFAWPAYAGYPDSKVVSFRALPDTSRRPFFFTNDVVPAPIQEVYVKHSIARQYDYPGAVWIPGLNFLIDEVEVPNIEWQHFLNQVAADSSEYVVKHLLPHVEHLPLADYFTNPFYRYYPVSGVSREQAEAFCRWRSAVVTAAYNTSNKLTANDPNYLRIHYRLPTEAEWEYAAEGYSGLPYGVNRAHGYFRINPKAATYLRTRAQLTQSEEQVRTAIEAFNRAEPLTVQFNCKREVPYFLTLPTPGYIFDLPQNDFGLYHMNGNVAELVQESGITKGGSYRDPLEACMVKARGTYTGPAPTIGFRCVCEASFPNRR
jgi:hypothetical protein